MEIRKAQRKKAKLRLGMASPSGAGKTYGALLIAMGIGGKIGLIDTENGSGDLYSHLGDYDIITIKAPYTINKYLEAMHAFEKANYDTVIIDSLSHAWSGEGGLLDKQGKIAATGANSYTSWRTITPEHNSLVEAILSSNCHVIATMRAKQEYVIELNDKGKQQPRKVGLAPIQREGMEYEFTIMLDIGMDHYAKCSKDRTGMFDGQFFKLDSGFGETLKKWLDEGIDINKILLEKTNLIVKLFMDNEYADMISACNSLSDNEKKYVWEKLDQNIKDCIKLEIQKTDIPSQLDDGALVIGMSQVIPLSEILNKNDEMHMDNLYK